VERGQQNSPPNEGAGVDGAGIFGINRLNAHRAQADECLPAALREASHSLRDDFADDLAVLHVESLASRDFEPTRVETELV